MNRFACSAILLLSPGLLLAAPAPTPTADGPAITGLWKTDGSIAGQQVRMMCALTETKHNLSGVCSGAQDGYAVHKIAGSVKGLKVQFYFQAAFGGNSLTLIVNGMLNEDRTQMDGDMEVAPMGGGMDAQQMNLSGTLTAVKELEHDPASAQALAAAAQTDAASAQAWAAEAQAEMAAGNVSAAKADAAQAGAIAARAGVVAAQAGAEAADASATTSSAQPIATGTWSINAQVQQAQVQMTCVLTEAAHKLAGSCTAGEDSTPHSLTGVTTAKGIGWHFDTAFQGQPITISMSATIAVDGAKMNGTISVAPMGVDGTFVAAKQ
jgi:hypothetical protein